MMVYLLPGSSPVIVCSVKLSLMFMLLWSLSEQPIEVSLCHFTTNVVTTEPAGTLPVIVIVVSVTVGGVLRTGADGTMKTFSVMTNSKMGNPTYPSEQAYYYKHFH